jgi:hypothetical protein
MACCCSRGKSVGRERSNDKQGRTIRRNSNRNDWRDRPVMSLRQIVTKFRLGQSIPRYKARVVRSISSGPISASTREPASALPRFAPRSFSR